MMRLVALVFLALQPVTFAVFAAETPFGAQNPTYLRSLINAREEEREANTDIEVGELLDQSIAGVASAFDSGDAGQLESLLSEKRKTFLDLEITGEENSHYAPIQVYHIFRRVFREVDTVAFEYDARGARRGSKDARVSYVWTYFDADEDEEVTVHLSIRFEKEKTAWRIYDIRER